MNRTHIHFALGLPSNRQVISGMRADCEVVIYIDMKAALQGEYYFGIFILPGNMSHPVRFLILFLLSFAVYRWLSRKFFLF